MSLGLHPECIQRLTEVLGTAIPKLTVEGRMISVGSFAHLTGIEKVLPKSGPVRDRLREWVSDAPSFSFFYHRLFRDVRQHKDLNLQGPIALTALPPYSDPAATASRLVAEFESLPWHYSFAMRMPSAFGAVFASEIKETQLSETLELFAPGPDHEQSFPLTRDHDPTLIPSSILGDATHLDWEPLACYLRQGIDGFVAPHAATAPMSAFLGSVRSFAGLGIALDLFGAPILSSGPFPLHAPYLVHRREGDRFVFDSQCEWSATHAKHFTNLELGSRAPRAVPEAGVWMRRILQQIATAFSEDEKARKIRLAAHWLFDSLCEDDNALGFVQATVVMEVLLGDKRITDLIGLGELLANRCAYLIARSRKSRDHLLKEFRTIYGIRSAIVHGGHSSLTTEEYGLLWRLRLLCMRVIRREIELLEKDSEEGRE